MILLSANEVGTPQTAERIERLSLLNGGYDTAIVLLLTGDNPMAALAHLQMEYVFTKRVLESLHHYAQLLT